MAVEQSKVNERYKAKFGSIGLSKTRLDVITAKLAAKIKDDATDDEIDAELNDLNEVYPFSEIKKNDDKVANERNNPNQKKTETKEENKIDDDVPKWAKTLLDEVNSLKSERQAETIAQKFASDERVKNIPEFIRKGFLPTSNEDFETKVTELLDVYTPFAEKYKLSAFDGSDNPATSTDTTAQQGKVKPITAEEAKAIVN